MTGIIVRQNPECNCKFSSPVAVYENKVQICSSYTTTENNTDNSEKCIFNHSKNHESISVENVDVIQSNSSCNIDLLQNGETKHKGSKNTNGIEDPRSSKNFKRRGHWLTYDDTSPVLRRFSIGGTGTEVHGRFSRKRSISSSCPTPRRDMPQKDQNIQYISSFHRSLKLLGLEPKDLGINNKTADGASNYSRPVRVEPTFYTRLTKRRFSLESLRTAIQDQIGDKKCSQDSLDRKTLSSAVYEEWYFQKQEEARRKKETEEIEKQKKQENLEKVKEQQRLKTEENFIKWKEQKIKQKLHEEKQKSKKKNTSERDKIINGIRRAKSNQDEVFLLWKREKDKIMKQKKTSKTEKGSSDNEEKKASAQIAYSLWKKQADEIFNEKKEENEKKKQKEEEMRLRKEKEKKESAEAAFCAWKKKKDEELRKKLAQNKLVEEERKSEKIMQETERLYDAERAFEDWLSRIEERRNKQIEAIQRARQKIQQQLAWIPGGKTHW